MPTYPQRAGFRPGPGGSQVAKNITAPTQIVGGGYGTVFRVFVNTAPSVAGGVYDVATGTTAKATALLDAATGTVDSVRVDDGGGGYSAAPTVTFSAPGGGGTTATGTAEIDAAGVVTDVTITDPGSGYAAAPTVTFSAPTGGGTSGATNLISVIPTVLGPVDLIAPFYAGLYVDPGTAGVVSISYSL